MVVDTQLLFNIKHIILDIVISASDKETSKSVKIIETFFIGSLHKTENVIYLLYINCYYARYAFLFDMNWLDDV